MNCSSCRVRGQKSKLSYTHSELGTRNVQACSLFYLLCAQERKGEKLIALFLLFTDMQQYEHDWDNNF